MLFPDKTKFNIDYSDEIMDLIQRLLEKDRTKRLGSKNDCEEVLSHPIFKKLNIDQIYNRTQEPPFQPDPQNMKFFNVDNNHNALQDTYMPKENKKMI